MAEMAKTPRFTKEEIIRIVKEQNIRFVRLQFTDIFGQCKNVAITESQLEKALANKCMFDGSSIAVSYTHLVLCAVREKACSSGNDAGIAFLRMRSKALRRLACGGLFSGVLSV